MQTLVLQAPGQLVLTEVDSPLSPKPGEALVRVRRIGVCGTDLQAYRGRQPFFAYPRMLGHELGVEVVELGELSTHIHVGDRCAVEPYLNCGKCIACRRGKTNCCENLRVLGVHIDGGMSEYLTVPVSKLHSSRLLTYEQLALVETLAIGAHAVERAAPHPDDTVLIVGAGPIGLAVLEAVRPLNSLIVIVDRENKRLQFVENHYPAVKTLLAGEGLEELLQMAFNGDLPTIVVDATGSPASMMQAFDYTAPGGKLVYVGLFQGDVTFPDPLFHRKEITLLASRNALPATFTDLIRRIENGELDTTPWITHRATLVDVPVQFPGWLDPANGVLKAVISV